MDQDFEGDPIQLIGTCHDQRQGNTAPICDRIGRLTKRLSTCSDPKGQPRVVGKRLREPGQTAYVSSSNSTLASCQSTVSNPSVNVP